MFQTVTSGTAFEEVEALSGALFSWCAERSIRLRSQEGVSAASVVIDLFLAGYTTQDEILGALSSRDATEITFS
ncbi:hypothetical protein [Pararhizobium gei]|uniref:hypothetical protein n=1 Tax=Pararhizobium gei TaxID=1395951 RepID=UPI0023DB60A2|nr:hypothetical protein [Rhizobium gei]